MNEMKWHGMKWMHERMIEMNKWMNEWMNAMNEWMQWMNEWLNEWMNEWTEPINGCVSDEVNAWPNGWRKDCMHNTGHGYSRWPPPARGSAPGCSPSIDSRIDSCI